MLLNLILLWLFKIILANSKSTQNNNILEKINFQSIEIKNLNKSFEHCLLEFKSLLFSLFDEYNNNIESEQLIEFEFFVNQSLNVCSTPFSNINELIDINNKYPTECLLFIQENNGSYENCFSLLNKLVNELENSKSFSLYKRENKTEKKLSSKDDKQKLKDEKKKLKDEKKKLKKENEQKAKEKKKKEQEVKNNMKLADKVEKKKQKELKKIEKQKSKNGKTDKTKTVTPISIKSKPTYTNNATTVLSSTLKLLTTADIRVNSEKHIHKADDDCEEEHGEEETESDDSLDEDDCEEDDDNKNTPMKKKITTTTVYQVTKRPTTEYEMLTKTKWIPYTATLIEYVTDTEYYTVTNSFVDFETVTSYELEISDTTTTVGKKTVVRKITKTNTKTKKLTTTLYDTVTLTTVSTSKVPTTTRTTETETSITVKTTTDSTTIITTRTAKFTSYLDTTTSTVTILLNVSSKICDLLGIVGLCSQPRAAAAAAVAAAKAKRDYDVKTMAADSLPSNTGISSTFQITQPTIYVPSLRNESTSYSRNFNFNQYNFSSSVNQANVGNSKYNIFPWVSTWVSLLFISIAVIIIM